MIDLIALSAAKKHADLLAMGLTSVSVDNTNKSITFTLAADGSQRTIYFDQPSDGISIVGVEIKNSHLICLMSDGSEIDAGILPSGGGGGGSVPKPLTYDYMPEGYPSKSGWSIEWNGNTDGLFSFLVEGKTFYKVSDMLPTADELIGATIEASSGPSHELASVDINAPIEDVTIVSNKAWIVRKDMTAPDMTQLQKGTYFVLTDKYYISRLSKQTVTPMAEEFLPPGQSAYAAAQSGGYTDTKENFYADLAAIQGLASELAAL